MFQQRAIDMCSGKAGALWFLWGFSLAAVAAGGVEEGNAVPAAEFAPASTIIADLNAVRHVSIEQFEFRPRRVAIAPGTTVIWSNDDRVKHDVTFQDQSLQSELFGHGHEVVVTFHEPGRYDYYCHVHPFMHGSVKVNKRSPVGDGSKN